MRLEDWAERLQALIDERRGVPFQWGTNDCTRFATDAEVAVCGNSRFSQYKQSHKTKRGAFAYLKKIGFVTTWELWDNHCQRKPVKMCQRGDFVGHLTDDGESIGVCLGGVFASPGDEGLVMFPMSKAKVGWSIDG